MHWAAWDEPWVIGSGELKSVALANAIILGIAVFRYGLLPHLRAFFRPPAEEGT